MKLTSFLVNIKMNNLDRYWKEHEEEWKRVLDEEFVGIGIAIENTRSPKEALNDLICWHIDASKCLDQMNSYEK